MSIIDGEYEPYQDDLEEFGKNESFQDAQAEKEQEMSAECCCCHIPLIDNDETQEGIFCEECGEGPLCEDCASEHPDVCLGKEE